MKWFQGLLVAVIFAVTSARVYDDKSDTIKLIEERFKEAEILKGTILRAIESELRNTQTVSGEADLIRQLEARINETKLQFEADADATIRTAIVEGKPIQVIDCIRNVTDRARDETTTVTNINKNNILGIKERKIQKIGFDNYAVNAIIKGLKELKDQSIEKIKKGEGVLAALKKEAFDRCDSAVLLLGEIEIRVTEPVLSKEYIKMRQKIDREVKDLKTKLAAELKNCLNKK